MTKAYQPYTGERVAEFSPDQLTAFQRIRDLVAGAPQLSDEALTGVRGYAGAPAQTVGTERVVDEGGRLGPMAAYVNPYVEAAMEPALRKIDESAAAARKRLEASQIRSGGAGGDWRSDWLQQRLQRDTSTAIGDVAARTGLSAWDRAMGLRGGDLDRMLRADIAGGQFGEQALGRQFTGARALQPTQQQQLPLVDAFLKTGAAQQARDQAELDAAFQEFLRQVDPSALAGFAGALKTLPTDVTQTSLQEDPWLAELVGQAVGTAARMA